MDVGKKLREALAKITRAPVVDEGAVKSLIKELQRVLLSSDVNVKLVFDLSKRIEERALHSEKLEGLTLREHVLKVVYEELAGLMGEGYTPRLDRHRILLFGLYGSGKTTTAAKLAYYYKSHGMKVGLIGADVDRPAAQEQLEQLAKKIGVSYYIIRGEKDAAKIVDAALRQSKDDIIIVDSAGRNAFDDALAKELKSIDAVLKPEERYLVISGDIGQVAGKQAEMFNSIAPLSGVIVTKMDGSGKGGGALSAVAATRSKIAFIGTGEKVEDIEVYDSKRFVGKLLGVPDIKGLIEKIQRIVEEEDLKRLESEEFNIKNFYEQMKAAKKMGPLGSVFSMLGMADIPQEFIHQSEEKMKKMEAIINSMTKAERKDADLIRKSRSRIGRIAKGAGCSEKEVREFLTQFERMEKMMKMFKKDRNFRRKMEKMVKGMPGISGLI